MKVLLVVYDNDSYITWFPQGLAYLASAIRKKGHLVTVYQQDIYHWPEEHLKSYLDEKKFDVVIVSTIGGYYQYRKLLKISEAINNSRNRSNFKYLIGGHGPAAAPEFFLQKTGADCIGIGEGDVTIIELLEAIERGRSFNDVSGIAFIENETFHKTRSRELIKNIDTIDMPAYDLFDINYYSLIRQPNIKPTERCLPVLSGRGCPYKCNFCYRMDKGFRPRSSESIIEEVEFLKEQYHVNYIVFSDELLMSSKQRTIELATAFINANLNLKWGCNGRLNFAEKEVLELMRDAGCVYIGYGIESLDNDTLNIMRKKLNRDMIIEGVENTLNVGISPGLNIIYGNIDEPISAIDDAVDFLLRYEDHARLRTIRPVTPYPGSELYEIAIQKGLLKDAEDFYENKHTNSDLLSVNFTKNTDNEIYVALYKANMKLIDKHFETKRLEMESTCKDLYFKKDVSFRGFRQT